jgi:uncharacterized membrane protein
MEMTSLHVVLLLSALLCSLVAGLLFGFAVVVMPGIARLSDREFLLAFKHMDGIIQHNQPLFLLAWVGSILSLAAALVLGTVILTGSELYLMWTAAVLYFLGVQLPTFRFNIPLNNSLQDLEIQSLDEPQLKQSRVEFETPWNRWNRIRTFNAISTVSALLVLLFQF